MSKGTADQLGISGHHRVNIVKAEKWFRIGSWAIYPFETIHDAAEPLGFLCVSGYEKLLYATDTAYIKPRFDGLTHLMVECNYSLEILRESVRAGDIPPAHKNRVMKSHMSLETLKGFLEANDLSKVQEIWLLHLSNGNSDEDGFKRSVEGWTGKIVKVARE